MNNTTSAQTGQTQTRIVFLPTPARGKIDTSKEAAESLPSKWLTGVRQRVYDLIAASGADGKTADEVEAETGLRQPTVAARCNELLNTVPPLVVRSGRRRPTRSNRSAHVLVLPQFVEGGCDD